MNEVKNKIDALVVRLQKIRDEVAVQINLGKAEAKTEWHKLEKKRHELEAQAKGLGEVLDDSTKQVASALELALNEVKHGYERVKHQLKK